MRRLLSFITLTLAATLAAQAGTGTAFAAEGFTAGPSRSVGVIYDDGKWYGELIAVDSTTFSSASAGVTQTVNACVAYGRSGGAILDSACGPVRVDVDPLLEVGRVAGTITGTYGSIVLDLTVTAVGGTTAGVTQTFGVMSVSLTGATSRAGDVSGTITTAFGTMTAAGSSWYGQLVQEAKAEVGLP